ncbi:hypothetical protein EIN_018780 [Entamoeba invadens IP1]|uniref:hypothetical protein n=1 Tax=Entamoeba invadens IP1 TaxID=370355 RepID=UPI0002C3F35E|nr:hypothetical protein EIN_018780 [Entamoeba invadens IP1]ELP90519.1 hypothetical protein EIN_018780 [Entamoeba invadens IP1]|eukprot:XP_004257290.1 hypothetical protein EIN_018780 [Entamoeba invadens IP1]
MSNIKYTELQDKADVGKDNTNVEEVGVASTQEDVQVNVKGSTIPLILFVFGFMMPIVWIVNYILYKQTTFKNEKMWSTVSLYMFLVYFITFIIVCLLYLLFC